MRLYHHINESFNPVTDDKTEALKLLKSDCSKYLKLIHGMEPFKRGMRQIGNEVFLNKKQTYDKRETRGDAFDYKSLLFINAWLKRNGHYPRNKNIIICSTSHRTSIFGNRYYIFPIRMEGYTFLRAEDFNIDDTFWDISEIGYSIEDIMSGEEEETKAEKHLDTLLNASFVSNKNIEEAHTKEYEIWFKCNEYYYIDVDKFDLKNLR